MSREDRGIGLQMQILELPKTAFRGWGGNNRTSSESASPSWTVVFRQTRRSWLRPDIVPML